MTTEERLDAIRGGLAERLERAREATRAAADAATRDAGTARELATLGTYLARLDAQTELTNVARALDALRGNGGAS